MKGKCGVAACVPVSFGVSMFPSLLLCAVLVQPAPAGSAPIADRVAEHQPDEVKIPAPLLTPGPAPPAQPPPPFVPAAPDRWLLMPMLQGTYPAWLLAGTKVEIYGWTASSFTASSDRHGQLPLGFHLKPHQPLPPH